MGHIPNHRMVVAFFFYEKTNTKKKIEKINTMPLFLEGVFIFNKDRESFVLAFFFFVCWIAKIRFYIFITKTSSRNTYSYGRHRP